MLLGSSWHTWLYMPQICGTFAFVWVSFHVCGSFLMCVGLFSSVCRSLFICVWVSFHLCVGLFWCCLVSYDTLCDICHKFATHLLMWRSPVLCVGLFSCVRVFFDVCGSLFHVCGSLFICVWVSFHVCGSFLMCVGLFFMCVGLFSCVCGSLLMCVGLFLWVWFSLFSCCWVCYDGHCYYTYARALWWVRTVSVWIHLYMYF